MWAREKESVADVLATVFCWHSTTGYCPFHPVPVCRLSPQQCCLRKRCRCIVIQFCQLVAQLCRQQLRLCATNNGSKLSAAVQCGSTLLRYTNSDTCVAGSAATGTRVPGVLSTEHGGVSCCPCTSAQNKWLSQWTSGSAQANIRVPASRLVWRWVIPSTFLAGFVCQYASLPGMCRVRT